MPKRLSIEVIKHSYDDVRLIIKHGSFRVRIKTNLDDAHKQLMDEIEFSDVFFGGSCEDL